MRSLPTLEEVRAAYAKTGLRPARGTFFPKRGCACPFGAMAMADGIVRRRQNPLTREYYAHRWTLDHFDSDAAQAFVEGMDGMRKRYRTAQLAAAYAHGRAIAAALFGESAAALESGAGKGGR